MKKYEFKLPDGMKVRTAPESDESHKYRLGRSISEHKQQLIVEANNHPMIKEEQRKEILEEFAQEMIREDHH